MYFKMVPPMFQLRWVATPLSYFKINSITEQVYTISWENNKLFPKQKKILPAVKLKE